MKNYEYNRRKVEAIKELNNEKYEIKTWQRMIALGTGIAIMTFYLKTCGPKEKQETIQKESQLESRLNE